MAGIVIIGAQWGDEGKGKVTDLMAEQADVENDTAATCVVLAPGETHSE